MTKYIIKVTYLEGKHKDKYYYLDKQGYVIDLENVWEYQAYTEKGCKIACANFIRNNKIDRGIEEKNREKRANEGKYISPYPIYSLCNYEPIAVDVIGG